MVGSSQSFYQGRTTICLMTRTSNYTQLTDQTTCFVKYGSRWQRKIKYTKRHCLSRVLFCVALVVNRESAAKRGCRAIDFNTGKFKRSVYTYIIIVAIILEKSLRKKKKQGLLSRSETILYIVSYILLYIGTR